MSGLTDLSALLEHLSPTLIDGEWVFVCCEDPAIISSLEPLSTFVEREGTTVICGKTAADVLGLSYEGVYRQITLSVHSSLEAVGLTAAIATALARASIPCNTVSAFYHDHFFIPSARAQDAWRILSELRRTGRLHEQTR